VLIRAFGGPVHGKPRPDRSRTLEADMTETPRTGEQPVERGAAEENAGAPLTQTEIDASRRAPSEPDADIITEDDGSGMAGGSSGGSGGGSNMPGHPDSAA
jgi:hypothetical protein